MRRREYLKLAGGGIGTSAVFSSGAGLVDTSATERTRTQATGATEWTFETDAAFEASPTVVDGAVTIGNADGTLYSVDTETGTASWETALDGAVRRASNVQRTDTISDPFESDVTDVAYTGTAAGTLYATDTRTGDTLWKNELTGERVTSPVAFDDRENDNIVVAMVGIVPEGSGPAVLSKDDGDGFKANLGSSPITTNAVTSSGGEYALCGTINSAQPFFLNAVSLGNSEIRWSVELDDTVYGTPTLLNDAWYFATAGGEMYSVTADGETRWQVSELNSNPFLAAPTAHRETVYFIDRGPADSRVYAVETETGAFRWRTALDGRVRASAPTVAGGHLYVGDLDGVVYKLDTGSGDIVQRIQLAEDGISSSPTVVGGTLYVGSDDGTLYAVDVADDQRTSSVGSRVRRGTSGHHFRWANRAGPQAWNRTQTITRELGSLPDYGNPIEVVDDSEILVGAPGVNTSELSNMGSVEVLSVTDGEWSTTATLFPDDLSADGRDLGWSFGRDIAVTKTTAVIGARETAFAYTKTAGGWSLQAELVPDRELTDVRYGSGVGLVDGTAVVTAPDEGDGAVYTFTEQNGTWTQTQRLTPPTDSAEFGSTVESANGRLFAAGSDIHVYENVGGDWLFRTTIPTEFLAYNKPLAVSSGLFAVGEPRSFQNGTLSVGRVAVFEGGGTDWERVGQLRSDNPSKNGRFGAALAIRDGELLVGAPGEEGYTLQPGTLYTTHKQNGEWMTDERVLPERDDTGIGGDIALTDDMLFTRGGEETNRTLGVYEQAAPSSAPSTGPPPVHGALAPPTDPDGDGAYEDVNGNGRADITDVQALFLNRDSSAVQDNTDAFDFDGDGGVGLGDVRTLLSDLLDR